MFAPIHVECPNCGEQICIEPRGFRRRMDDPDPSVETSYEAEAVCECGRFEVCVVMRFAEGEENVELTDIAVGLAPTTPMDN
jgi:hypothetical protein